MYRRVEKECLPQTKKGVRKQAVEPVSSSTLQGSKMAVGSVPGGFWPYTDPGTYSTNIDQNETARNSAIESVDIPIILVEQDLPEPLKFDESVYEPPQNYKPSNHFQFSTHTQLPLLNGKNLIIKLPHSNRILKQIEPEHHGKERYFQICYF